MKAPYSLSAELNDMAKAQAQSKSLMEARVTETAQLDAEMAKLQKELASLRINDGEPTGTFVQRSGLTQDRLKSCFNHQVSLPIARSTFENVRHRFQNAML